MSDDLTPFRECNGCGLCLMVCPSWRESRDPEKSARGFVRQIRFEVVPSFDDLYHCSLCGACDPVCPREIKPVDMILALRRHLMRQGANNDLRQRIEAMLNKPRPQAEPQPGTIFIPDQTLLAAPDRLRAVQQLLGSHIRLATDFGDDIALALEAGLDIPSGRLSSFLTTLYEADTIIVADGLLFRQMHRWLGEVALTTLGETLSTMPLIRDALGAGDLYLIETRGYHAEQSRLVHHYDRLASERGCTTNLDLQHIAIGTNAGSLLDRFTDGVTTQSHINWLLAGRKISRVIAEWLPDAEAFRQHSSLPVLHISEVA